MKKKSPEQISKDTAPKDVCTTWHVVLDSEPENVLQQRPNMKFFTNPMPSDQSKSRQTTVCCVISS